MAEYIEREQVISAIKRDCPELTIYTKNEAVSCIESIPAADVAQVVHGHWDDGFDGITPFCSVCGRSHHTVIRMPNYCPNCGAKMDEKSE